ncbi:MAG TPA: hypothetical protein VNT03_01725 [Baekduia sp.]|nr:hypothetical protein [Baekduia sp.]
MASQRNPTRAGGGPPPAPPPAAAASEGIDLATLFLSAVASAAAAYITSKIWAPGTLFSAAMSPVIVALVKEGLRKPTEKVAEVVPAVVATPSRWTRAGASRPGYVPEPAGAPPAPPEPVDPDAPHVVLPPFAGADHGPVRVYSTRARRLRWRLALITGLLGFVVCVVLYTVPELIAGQSIGRGSGQATTIFGGHSNNTKKSSTTKTTTSTTTTATETQATTTPDDTQTETTTTPSAPSTATPAAPSTATPAPSSATPGTAQEQAPPTP